MDTNECLKWRTDYSSLLKCWSLIKTSEYLKEKAYKELKRFRAEDKALDRLKRFLNKNDLKTSFEQTINLWNKSIDQFLIQKNFLGAAECLENLSDFEFKYGSPNERRESLYDMLRASKYFNKCNQQKRAIIALKRVLTVVEFSPKNDINLIADKYEESVQLYESLDLTHLAKINRKISKFLREENSVVFPNKLKSAPSEQSLFSQGSGSMGSIPSQLSFSSRLTNYSEEESDSEDNHSDCESIKNKDCKEWVRRETRLLNQSTAHSSTSASVQEADSESDDSPEPFKPVPKIISKQLLRKNLRQLKLNWNTSGETEVERNVSKKAKLVVRTQNQMTTEIIPVEGQNKRKRRPKPKELSEELPEKRILKLRKSGIPYNYVIDPKAPKERLLCTLCDETILSYRWSIVTDHLDSKKHKTYTDQQIRNLEMFCENYSNNYNNYNYNNDNINNEIPNNNYLPGVWVTNINQNQKSGQMEVFGPSTGQQCWEAFDISFQTDYPSTSTAVMSSVPLNPEEECRREQTSNEDKTYQSLETPPIPDSNSNPFDPCFQQI